MATEVSDSSKELGNQIAQLMATLNRAEQGTHPASAPNSPRHRGHGRGRMDRNTPIHPSSHNGWTGLGQNTFAHSSSITGRVNHCFTRKGKYPNINRCTGQCPKYKRLQHSAMFQVPGLGSYGKGVCNSSKAIKQVQGEPRECGQTRCSTHPVNLQHSLPDLDPKPTHMKAAERKGQQQVAPYHFLIWTQ